MSITLVYFSNHSGNTQKFIERLGVSGAIRIPIDWDNSPITVSQPFVLVVPTYGGGSERTAIPRQVRHFLNVRQNRDMLRGVIGMGNTNFGEHFCKAAEMVSKKAKVPLIAKVEIFGTDYDIQLVKERLRMLYDDEQ